MCLLKKSFFFILCSMPFFADSEKLSSKIQIPVQKYKLNNGLRVLLNPDDKVNTASYILGIATGSRHEKPGITGISHMFEHLMFKGTKKYPHFNKTYADNGVINVNAFTSKDYTAYLGSFPPDKLELILDMESNRMSKLNLSQGDLDKERGAVLEERLLGIARPSTLLVQDLFGLIFTKHPYRWPVIGYEKDIVAYSLEDLRSWYSTYYSPNNAVLVISGKFSAKKAKKLIKKYFGSLVGKQIPKEVKVVEPEQTKTRFHIVNKEVQSPIVAIAYLAPPSGSKDLYALEFISHILGSGESSILYKRMVREHKLLSSISSGVYDFLDYSVFYIYYPLLNSLKEEEVKKIVLKEVREELNRGISKKSVEKVKNIQMTEMVYSLKRSMHRAGLLLDYELQFNDYRRMYEKLDLLDEMSPEFIRSVGEKYLNSERMSYVILKSEKAQSKKIH